MAISQRDRRVLLALKGARTRVGAASSKGPRGEQLRSLAFEVLDEAYEALNEAVDTEDRLDTEAELASLARRRAFADLRALFGRLYAGLQARCALAAMRGAFEDPGSLSTFLSDATPTQIRDASFGHVLRTVEHATAFVDDFLPAEAAGALRCEAEAAVARARQALRAADRAQQRVTDARTVLFQARVTTRERYHTARDLLSAALREEGRRDRLDVVLPPFRHLTRGGGGRASTPEDEPEGEAPDLRSPR